MKYFSINSKLFKKFFKLLQYTLITYFIICLIYPERFLYFDLRFTSSHSVGNFYQSALFHAKYIKSLNFDFWNFFDQSNTAFYHLAQGFYNVTSLIEGILYNFLSLFKSDNFFRLFHSFFIQILFIFFRTVGIILILDLYKAQKYLYLPIIIFINIMISSVTIIGYEASLIYSLSPILIYYLINFLKNNNLTSLIFFLIFYAFIFSQIPLLSLSYFFIPFHFIFITYILVVLFEFFFQKKIFYKKYKNFFVIDFSINIYFLLMLISIFVIVIFNSSLFFVVADTTSLTGSLGRDGLATESRLENFLNPLKYFKTYIPNARCIIDLDTNLSNCTLSNFFSFFFNFNDNQWFQAPVFMGFTVIFVSLFGLIFSRYKEKWYFFSAILFVLALQGPRDFLIYDINFYANVFTALLNPFSFLIQHTHMVMLLLPFLLIPLFIIGFSSLCVEIKKNFSNLSKALFILLILFIFAYLLILGEKVQINVILTSFFIILLILSIYLASNLKKNMLTLFLVSACFIIDAYALKIYFGKDPISSKKYLPVYITNLETPKNIKHYIDNPNPFDDKINNTILINRPLVKIKKNKSKEDLQLNKYYFNKNLYIGEFYKTNFFFRFLEKPIIYELRHKTYKQIYKYKDTQYFRNDMLIISFFNKAIKDNEIALSSFFENGNLYENNIFISTKNELSDYNYKSKNNLSKFTDKLVKLNVDDIEFVRKHENKNLYRIKRPNVIPNYINGSIFSNSQQIKFYLNDVDMIQTYGELFLENTFNIDITKNNFIYFLVENEIKPIKLEVIYKKFNLINDFYKNKDSFHFNLNSITDDGWLLLKFPYDRNWKIFADNQQLKIFRANGFWLGVEVKKNTKDLVVKYSLNKYFINQITLIFYYLSMIYILFFLIKYNFLLSRLK